MDSTTPVSTLPASSTDWNKTLDALLNTGSSIFGSLQTNKAANTNAAAQKKTDAVTAASTAQQSALLKYALLGGAALLGIVALVLFMRRGR